MKKLGAAGILIAVGFLVWAVAPPVDGPSAAAATLTGEEALSAAHMTPQEHAYVGARDGCRKCHLREYRSWESTPHATALNILKEKGEDSNPDCVKCHVTGYGTDTGYQSEEATPELAAVTCEACHGPGADYRDRDVMKDLDAAKAAGLHIPDEATCRGCHNEESPEFPGEFNFEEMKAKGVHEIRR